MAVLKTLTLQDIRNHQSFQLEPSAQVTVVVAPNASGKTAILEALALVGTGDSFRADTIAEVIRFGQEYGRVTADLADHEDVSSLEILITRGQVQGKRTQSRLYTVNQVRRRRKDLVGQLPVVVFRPEDMRLMEGSPGRRRRFLDTVLSMVSPQYAAAHRNYEQVLLRRNRLIGQIKDGIAPRATLNYWTNQLLLHGAIVQTQRQQFLAFCHTVQFMVPFTVEYQPSIISAERLAQYAEKELAAGHTLIGPHKDDFMVMMQFGSIQQGEQPELHELASFGSRGQQRMGVLWMKICELEYIDQTLSRQPVLCLDDIMSELDQEVRQRVMELFHRYQSIVTTTDEHVVEEIAEVVPTVKVLKLSAHQPWYTLPKSEKKDD